MITRVEGRDFISIASLVDPCHEIESFKGMTIRVGQLIGLGLPRQAMIDLLVQPGKVVLQDSHLRDGILVLAMFVMSLVIWPSIVHIISLPSASLSSPSTQGHLSGHKGWYKRRSWYNERSNPWRPTG